MYGTPNKEVLDMLTVNLEKAKVIAHELRRKCRDKEFEPYDAVIMKQIPGKDHAEAEGSRQTIREKYAVVQNNINAATTVEELAVVTPKFIFE
jgi:hypothetical protein